MLPNCDPLSIAPSGQLRDVSGGSNSVQSWAWEPTPL
jgi:hypothetical protein